jgi:hypothetical protein
MGGGSGPLVWQVPHSQVQILHFAIGEFLLNAAFAVGSRDKGTS